MELAIILGGLAGAVWLVVSRGAARRRVEKRDELFDRFDTDAAKAMQLAVRAAKPRGQLGDVHVLWGLLHVESFAVAIEALGGSPPAIEKRVLTAMEPPVPDLAP